MRCPYCGETRDKVIDSRGCDDDRQVRRRRVCLSCDRRFTTYEQVEEKTHTWVIKKDGARVPYDRQKVIDGLEKSCYKRPVSARAMTQLVEEVEEELARRFEREVETAEIGRAVAERLKSLDQVAYVRFASVYREFKDVSQFLDELKPILEAREPSSK